MTQAGILTTIFAILFLCVIWGFIKEKFWWAVTAWSGCLFVCFFIAFNPTVIQ
jgi:hypothetical protein